jgi:alpha-D-ribose 1-methylphosphonate 5-triphosphate synthase subunit PhnG
LEAAWDALKNRPSYRWLRRPEIGLVMARGRIGGTGRAFNLGEMTMTRAAIQLLDATGGVSCTGFGHVAGRSARHAELVALFDALLQDPDRSSVVMTDVIDPLATRQQVAKAAQSAKVMASKVEFFTMVRGE